jgi:hypothetical protein
MNQANETKDTNLLKAKTALHYQVLKNQSLQTGKELDILYDHFLDCVQTESASQVIARFRLLLIEAENYPEPKIKEILNIIYSQQAELDISSFLNHCCQLFISHWSMDRKTEFAIFELLALFTNLPSPRKNTHKLSKSWQQWMKNFAQTPQYLKLKRLAYVINPRLVSDAPKPQYLGDLIGRYPFLYKHCLVDYNSLRDYRSLISRIKKQRQLTFEHRLVKLVTLQTQQLEVARLRQLTTGFSSPINQSFKNPTLLSDKGLKIAVQKFTKVTQDHKSQTQQINLWTKDIQSLPFKEFKNWLVDYLLGDFDELSGREKLKQHLLDKFLYLLPNYDAQPVNEFLILRSCSQLLNGLVVDNIKDFNHFTFINLTTCLGATNLVSLLDKLVRLAPKLESRLSYRLAQLFEYYESTPIQRSYWLIKVLENFLVAFTLSE